MEHIYLSPPDVTDAERRALLAAFDSGWVAPAGPDLDAFEGEMCSYLGLEPGSAVALASGTAALHLALMLAGVGPGDEVWTSTFTSSATLNPVTYLHAVPVFFDVDPATWQVDLALLEKALTEAAGEGRLPRAVLPVDLYGQCPDYGRLAPLCEELGVVVVEDATESLGALCGDRRSGTFGLAAALSFDANKVLTTSVGGMLVSPDHGLVARARELAQPAAAPARAGLPSGRSPAPTVSPEATTDQPEVGYSYGLSNLLAGVGRAQLARLGQMLATRRATRATYELLLGDIDGLSFMPETEHCTPNRWLTCVTLDRERLAITPLELCDALAAQAIEARPLWQPLHLQTRYADAVAIGGEVAERLHDTGVCLPSGSSLRGPDIERVVGAVRGILMN